MPINPKRLLQAAFAETAPFKHSRILERSNPQRLLLLLEVDPSRVATSPDRKRSRIEVFFDDETEILTFWITQSLPEGISESTAVMLANRLNRRKGTLSRVVILSGAPPSLASILAINTEYLDPDKVTGFQEPMRLDIEYFITEAMISLTSLLTLLP